MLNRIHNSKVVQSCLVQLVQTVDIIEAIEAEDGEVLGHVDGGQQLVDAPRLRPLVLPTLRVSLYRAQPHAAIRNCLNIQELEVSDPTSAMAPPSPVRIRLDNIDNVTAAESESLSVVRVRGEVSDGDGLANEGSRELLSLLRLHSLDPRRDHDQLLLLGEPLHGLAPDHADLLVGRVHLTPHRVTQSPRCQVLLKFPNNNVLFMEIFQHIVHFS